MDDDGEGEGGRGRALWTGLHERPDPTLVEQLSHVVEVALSERDVEAALERERIGQLLILVQERLLNPTASRPFLEQAGLGTADIVVSKLAWRSRGPADPAP